MVWDLSLRALGSCFLQTPERYLEHHQLIVGAGLESQIMEMK